MSEEKTDPYYKGRPTPKHLRDGPTNDRKCTDFLCFLIFGAFWAGLILMSITAFSKGNPESLIRPWDQFGNACGATDQTQDYPYLFWVLDQSGGNDTLSMSDTVCVKSCPDGSSSKGFGQNDCSPDYAASGAGSCDSLVVYPTTQVEFFCIPEQSDDFAQLFPTGGINFDFTFQAVADLKSSWWMIIVVGVIALIFGFMYMTLMKYFSGVIIWALLILWVLIWTAFGVITLEDAMNNIIVEDLQYVDTDWLYIIAGVSLAIAFISLVIICCFRSRINLAVAVLKASADYIEDEKAVLLLPPVFFVFNILFYVFWVFVAIYIFSMNATSQASNDYPVPDISWSSTTIGFACYHVFALLWNHAFLFAFSQFIIASSVCLWYFKQGSSDNVGTGTIGTSIKRAFLHIGSIAFGSFILAVVEAIKFVLDFIANRVKKATGNKGPGAELGFCLKCCTCFVGCFETSLKFISRHAFIQIAMTSENFCQASEDAFHLLLRNTLRFGTVHGLAWVFMKLGELVISAGATFCGYMIMKYFLTTTLVSPILSSIIFFLASLSVAHVFMSVYGTSADTIIHCFAMDDEIHDGEVKFAPKELRDFIDTHAGVKKLTLNEY